MKQTAMTGFTSFNASQVSVHDVGCIVRDYLELDRARMWRRLFVVRFGLLALVAFLVGHLIPGLSIYGRWVPVALFLVPPLWAVLVELRLTFRLFRRFDPADACQRHPAAYTVVMDRT